jgi:Xaa-Pro aminopeptidase
MMTAIHHKGRLPMPITALSLEVDECRARQRRLCEAMSALDIDRAVVTSADNVQYLTGFRPHRLMAAAAALDADGHCVLAAPNQAPDQCAADEVVSFEAQWCATLRQDQAPAAATALKSAMPGQAKRIAVEHSLAGPHWMRLVGDLSETADIEPTLGRLRRRKHADELALIRRAIECTDAMYSRAKEIIRPGINELTVYSELHAAAVEVAGEPLVALGNDFQCGTPGGPARGRGAKAGELYILDLGPCYRGYYADNCRTFTVNQEPTDEQYQAWEAIVAVLDGIESQVRPGVSCRETYEYAKAMLDEFESASFPHHLGHGFGLFPHEAPHLNPHWNDCFEEGDVFTAEPGLYAPALRGGIRLEQNYRVTSIGVERLTDSPLELA